MLSITACTQRHVEVCWEASWVEHSASITPQVFMETYNRLENKIRLGSIPADTLDMICKGIKLTNNKKKHDICCSFYVQIDSLCFFLDSFGRGHTVEGDSIYISPYAFYLLNCYSGYYNVIVPEDLKYQPEIRRFGIPSNYHYIICDEILPKVCDSDFRVRLTVR